MNLVGFGFMLINDDVWMCGVNVYLDLVVGLFDFYIGDFSMF